MPAPENKGESTLTTSLGWRIRKVVTPRGVVLEWRCPTCWKTLKEAEPAGGEKQASIPAPTPPARRRWGF
jgi:hypothetical protein